MNYVSTRGAAPVLSFDDVLVTGLARDGGLYVPAVWPEFSPAEIGSWKNLSYEDLAFHIIAPFVGNVCPDNELKEIIASAYSHFDATEIAPIIGLGDGEWIMELFHGPTLAFKDIAMQFLGPMFERTLRVRGQRICIVGATSGDTGSAAIEACRDRENIEAFILYPHGRVSAVQRKQMTTVVAPNIQTIALQGSFDDCQDIVKALFNDLPFRDRMNLSAVNSINWARIVAQIVYYFWAALKVGGPETPVSFAVPTGNFGNVFAGYAAYKMGLPINQFFIGSNSNDILTRFFESGTMAINDVIPTLSPSMDIQISSNFERLLFELYGRNGDSVAATLSAFRKDGRFTVENSVLQEACKIFRGERYTDEETLELMASHYKATGKLLDPHTAVGLAVGRQCHKDKSCPIVTLATAHPAKFPAAVEMATDTSPMLPKHISDLFNREEHINLIDNDIALVKDFIESKAKSGANNGWGTAL